MHILLFILYLAVFIGLIAYWDFFEVKGIKRRLLIGLFLIKLVFGFGLAWLYTDHYENRRTGDAYRFFDDGEIMYSSLENGVEPYLRLLTGIGLKEDPVAMTYYLRMTHLEKPFYSGYLNDNATIIRANAIVMLFSRGHYHVHTAFWCFFAMIGLTAIFKLLIQFFPNKRLQMFFAVFLLPTVMFWASGVLKEPLLLMGLGLFILGFIRYIMRDYSRKDILSMCLGFVILLIAKGYVVQCMAPALLGLLTARFFPKRNFWLMFSIPHVLVVCLLFVGPYISNGLKVVELMSLKQTAFYNIATESSSGSLISLPPIHSPVDIMMHSPNALIATYMRPYPWEWTKALYIPASIENLFLLLALAICLWNFRKPAGMGIPIIAFSLSFVLVFGVLTGSVVPVIGALVRYKLPALIFLFVLIFALTDDRKLTSRFPILKRLSNII